jgi:hypothetical protein
VTPTELLRDLRAAHEARRNYRRFADALWELATWAYERNYFGWAKDCWQFAIVAENAIWAEEKDPEPEP